MIIPDGILFADGTRITTKDVIALERVDHFKRNNFTTYCVIAAHGGQLRKFGITKEEYEHLRRLLKEGAA